MYTSTEMGISKIYSIRYFWTFHQISLNIIFRALAVKWNHSAEHEKIVGLNVQFLLNLNEVPSEKESFLCTKEELLGIFTNSVSLLLAV